MKRRILVLVVLILVLSCSSCNCQLSPSFYDRSCPGLVYIVRAVLRSVTGNTISLLRLHFHDCLVNGCDGSILLDDYGSFVGEKTASANNNSISGFEIMDLIKEEVERYCPGIVSCADILTLAAREVVVQFGGPTWQVSFGRRDSTTAFRSAADRDLPTPTKTLQQLIELFESKGFTPKEMVALSGAHTIGQAHCASFEDRLRGTGDPTLSTGRLEYLRDECKSSPREKLVVVPLDLRTPRQFDVSYYSNLVSSNGLLSSDQLMYKSFPQLVAQYSDNQRGFFEDFAAAIVKLGNLSPLTGYKGQVRRRCRYVN